MNIGSIILKIILTAIVLVVTGFILFFCFFAIVCGGQWIFAVVGFFVIVAAVKFLFIIFKRRKVSNFEFINYDDVGSADNDNDNMPVNKEQLFSTHVSLESNIDYLQRIGHSYEQATLMDYIIESKKTNEQDETIKKSLKGAGWSDEDIDRAFKTLA